MQHISISASITAAPATAVPPQHLPASSTSLSHPNSALLSMSIAAQTTACGGCAAVPTSMIPHDPNQSIDMRPTHIPRPAISQHSQLPSYAQPTGMPSMPAYAAQQGFQLQQAGMLQPTMIHHPAQLPQMQGYHMQQAGMLQHPMHSYAGQLPTMPMFGMAPAGAPHPFMGSYAAQPTVMQGHSLPPIGLLPPTMVPYGATAMPSFGQLQPMPAFSINPTMQYPMVNALQKQHQYLQHVQPPNSAAFVPPGTSCTVGAMPTAPMPAQQPFGS